LPTEHIWSSLIYLFIYLFIHSFIQTALCSNSGINHSHIDQVQYWENGFSIISIQEWRAFRAAVGRVKVLMKSWLSNSWPVMTHNYYSVWSITDSSETFFISSSWALCFFFFIPTYFSLLLLWFLSYSSPIIFICSYYHSTFHILFLTAVILYLSSWPSVPFIPMICLSYRYFSPFLPSFSIIK